MRQALVLKVVGASTETDLFRAVSCSDSRNLIIASVVIQKPVHSNLRHSKLLCTEKFCVQVCLQRCQIQFTIFIKHC
jgi:hypothetical protein